MDGGGREPSLCAREAAACADDAECGSCSAMAMGWGWREAAELAGFGAGGGRGAGGGAGSSWDLFFEAAAPAAARCEKVGATVCSGFADAAAAAAQGEETEEGLSSLRRVDSCLRNGMVQALMACRVRTVGCEPDDSPCITPKKQRVGRTSSRAGESNARGDARSAAPRPLSEGLELAVTGQALPSAGAAGTSAKDKAGAEGPGLESATSYRRRLVTSSEASSTCDGIQSGSSCCGETCGECGGSGCSERGNGAEDCCTRDILDSGILCSDTGGAPPCIVDGKG